MAKHYVDNKKLYNDLCAWKKEWLVAKEKKQALPPLTNEIAEQISEIARRVSFKPNFANYTFREDMIGDAIQNCVSYIHNFNPDRSTNAFAYVTQIIHHAFLRRIQMENKHLDTKKAIVGDIQFDQSYVKQSHDRRNYGNSYVSYLKENLDQMREVDKISHNPSVQTDKKKAKKKVNSLEEILA